MFWDVASGAPSNVPMWSTANCTRHIFTSVRADSIEPFSWRFTNWCSAHSPLSRAPSLCTERNFDLKRFRAEANSFAPLVKCVSWRKWGFSGLRWNQVELHWLAESKLAGWDPTGFIFLFALSQAVRLGLKEGSTVCGHPYTSQPSHEDSRDEMLERLCQISCMTESTFRKV